MAQKRKQPPKPKPRTDHDEKLHRWALQMNTWVAQVQAWMWASDREPACGGAKPVAPGTPVPMALMTPKTGTQPPPPPPPKYPPA
jgi:hypothetical protein